MSAKPANNPFAIQLEVEFLDRLSEPVREGRVKSVSDLIRTALENYDFDNVVVVRPAQLMISVRLPLEIRRKLKQLSKTKHTSVGQLVRAAVEAYLPQLEHAAVPGGIEMPIPHVELPEISEPAETPPATDASSTVLPGKAPKKTPRAKKPKPAVRSAPRKKSPKSPAKKVAAKPAPKAKPPIGRGLASARGKGMTRKRAQG